MTDSAFDPPASSGVPRDPDIVGELLRVAGRRPEPPAFRAARVRATVEAEWRESVRRRNRRSLWLLAPIGLAAAAAVFLWVRWPAPAPGRAPLSTDPIPVAVLSRLAGPVRFVDQQAGVDARQGARVNAGNVLDTGDTGRAAVALGSGAEVRIDRMSRVAFVEPGRLSVERGRIYVDSGRDRREGHAPVQIETPAGVVHEIGTQYEVAIEAGLVTVRVREGSVRVEQARGPVALRVGEGVRLSPSGVIDRRTIDRAGPGWAWIESVRPPFEIEGATLESFLDWASRELGVEWQYRDLTSERHGKTVVLHGSIEDLTTSEAIDAILATCGMNSRMTGGRLVVGLEAP